MNTEHHYQTTIRWMGNRGVGTIHYQSYGRDFIISADNKADIAGSSDPAFRGDKSRYNPEDLLVAALSSCHMLWYLHLCAESGVVVTDYLDHASGVMIETENGGGKFREVTLHPIVTIASESMRLKAEELHQKANELCFIANSVNFLVHHQPITNVQSRTVQ